MLVIRDYIRFLEERAAEHPLRVIVACLQWEIARGFRDEGEDGVEVEGGVRQNDVDAGATAEGVAQREGYVGVDTQEAGVHFFGDEVHVVGGVVLEAEV